MLKKMNKKRIIAAVLILCLLAGGVYGVAQAILNTTSSRTVMVIQASEVNYGGWYYDQTANTSGRVTTEAVQNIYLSDTLTVKEVCVQEGQPVKKGDVLLIYDETQTSLALEKAELNLAQVQLGIQVAEKNLDTLHGLSPVSGGGGGDIIFPDETSEPDPAEQRAEILEHLKAYTELTKDSLAFNDPETIARLVEKYQIKVKDLKALMGEGNEDPEADQYPLGTRKNPYRFLVKNDSIITINPDFIKMLIEKWKKQIEGNKSISEEDKKAVYFILEAHEGDTVSGEPIRGKVWGRNAYLLSLEKKAIKVDFRQLTPEQIPEKETPQETTEAPQTETKKQTETETETVTETQEQTEPSDTETEPSSQETETETETERSSETEESETASETEFSSDVTQTGSSADTAVPSIQVQSRSGLSLAAAQNQADPRNLTVSLNRVASQSLSAAQDLIDAVLVHASEFGEKGGSGSSISLVPGDAQYTAEELKQAIKDEEKSLRDLKLQEREANLSLKKAKKAKEAGVETAKLDGTVTIAGDIKNPPTDGSPFLQVSGAAGLYVMGGLSELLLGEVAPGDHVSVLSWQSGSSYEAEITDISPYPDTTGQFSGYGETASASYYPFTARILDESAKLNANEYLDITIGGGDAMAMMYGESDEFYLYKAFVLEDEEGKYVYKRGDDGKLTRQIIETGQMRNNSWEILSGLTTDDWIAFPYGKQIREGAKCKEATVMELYEASR